MKTNHAPKKTKSIVGLFFFLFESSRMLPSGVARILSRNARLSVAPSASPSPRYQPCLGPAFPGGLRLSRYPGLALFSTQDLDSPTSDDFDPSNQDLDSSSYVVKHRIPLFLSFSFSFFLIFIFQTDLLLNQQQPLSRKLAGHTVQSNAWPNKKALRHYRRCSTRWPLKTG